MEKIRIKNFGGLENIEVSLNKINIFIGRQASGKSVTVKLIFFFKTIFREIFDGIIDDKSKSEIDQKLKNKFQEFFPMDSWSTKNFEINYFFNEEVITLKRKDKNNILITYSLQLQKQFTSCKRIFNSDKKKFVPKDKFEIYRPGFAVNERFFSLVQKEFGKQAGFTQIFIPAGRSFFANLQSSIFSFLSNNKAIDPFLVQFGSFYENMKPIANRTYVPKEERPLTDLVQNLINDILGSKYSREQNKDFLIHEDKRKINVSYASSGQQETLPLVLILKALLRINFIGDGATLYIEEPEAHLFPSAQRKVIELLATVFNNASCSLQILITTHSPYVLTSFNNLLFAGSLFKDVEINKRQLEKLVPNEMALNISDLNAYSMQDKTIESIIDEDSSLIRASFLDNVSEEIAIQFDNLLNLSTYE